MLPRQFMEDERPAVQQRLNNKISSIVLSKRAERDLGKKDKFDEKLNELAETELRRFIYDEHGGNGAEADEALRKLGMNRTTYKQWKKKELLARYLVESKYSRNRPITYSELQERYEEMKKAGNFVLEAVLQWRLIDVSVDKMGAKYPNEDASLKARQLAEDLRRRIDAGADFADLAKKYSDGPRSEEGGLWPARDPNALATPYDVLAKRAQEVAQGQVAGPIESSGHFFLMRIEKKQQRSYVPLNDVQDEVRKDILDGRWNEVFNEMDAEVRRQVDLAHTDRFVDFCLERFYQQAHAKDKDKG
jgi:parvulin-like peptidyl-prolyl isomerase